jgi:hypothetical protein
MAPALALRHDHAPTPTEALPTRDEALARYRHLRQISRGHNSAMMELLSIGAILQQARRLGLADGRAFVLDRMDDMSYVWDLVIHTAPPGRSRAIDRYARSARLAPGSDEAIVLDAMCKARFAVIAVKDRHPVAGLIVTDLFRGAELWIVDEGLEMSLAPGATIATRYFSPRRHGGRRHHAVQPRSPRRRRRVGAAGRAQAACGGDRRSPSCRSDISGGDRGRAQRKRGVKGRRR